MTEAECVYCAVRAGSLIRMQVKFSLSFRAVAQQISTTGAGFSATNMVLPCQYHCTDVPVLSPQGQTGEAWEHSGM